MELYRKTTPQGAVGGATPADNPRTAQLKSMFTRLAGTDGEIDSEELQDVLTASFSKGELKIRTCTCMSREFKGLRVTSMGSRYS